MCRNIRVLYRFEPPTTEEEVRAAALQYVRKVSGLAKPSAVDQETFEGAVDDVAAATQRLLGSLRARTSRRRRGRAASGARPGAHRPEARPNRASSDPWKPLRLIRGAVVSRTA